MFCLYQIRYNSELKSIFLYFAFVRFCNHESTWFSYVLLLSESRTINLDESSYIMALLDSITMKLHVLLFFCLCQILKHWIHVVFFSWTTFVRFQNHEIIWSHINFLPFSNFHKHELAQSSSILPLLDF
jgi:hypothetical protein